MPPGVAAVCPGSCDGTGRTLDDQHSTDGRRGGHRRIGDRLQPDPRAAPEEAVGGDQHRRLAIGQARGDRRRPIAREDRRVDRLEPSEREDGDHGFDQHREQDPDSVAGPDAVGVQPARGGLDRRRQLGVGQLANGAVLAFPGDRSAVGIPGYPWINGRSSVVPGRARPPACPRRTAARVEDGDLGDDPRRSRGRRRRRPRTSPDRRPPAPGVPRARARRSSAGTERVATRGGAPPSDARPPHRRRARRSASRAPPAKGTPLSAT